MSDDGGPEDDEDERPLEPFPFMSKRRRRPEIGTLEVFAADEQLDHSVDLPKLQHLAEQVLVGEGMAGDAELGLRFVDETVMAELNERFMSTTGPTDVLAFPMEDDLVTAGRSPDNGTSGPAADRVDIGDPPLLLGDVVVCPAVAARNAEAHSVTFEGELALLVIHGVLHVLGMDHAEPEEEAQMKAKERTYLQQFHAGWPSPP